MEGQLPKMPIEAIFKVKYFSHGALDLSPGPSLEMGGIGEGSGSPGDCSPDPSFLRGPSWVEISPQSVTPFMDSLEGWM